MINSLFTTIHAQQLWNANTDNLHYYYNSLNKFQFEDAINQAEHLKELITQHVKTTNDSLDDDFYNDCFIYRAFCSLMRFYAEYWKEILVCDFRKSWESIQNVLDTLRILNKFSAIDETIFFRFIEKQFLGLEKLYPYNLFGSTEMIVESFTCSICNKNIESFDCPHIQGELYRGILAQAVCKKVKELLSVSIVENPEDKRCVITSIGGNPMQFPAVSYLNEILTIEKISPLRISHTQETTQATVNIEKNLHKNSKCYCGSGKKYKQCCLKEDKNRKHVKIICLPNSFGFSRKDFILMQSRAT